MVRGVNFSDRQYVKRATRLIDLDQEALKVPANQAAAQMDSDLKACFQHFFYTAPSWLWDAGIIPKQ